MKTIAERVQLFEKEADVILTTPGPISHYIEDLNKLFAQQLREDRESLVGKIESYMRRAARVAGDPSQVCSLMEVYGEDNWNELKHSLGEEP